MTTYRMETSENDLVIEGSISDIFMKLPAGSRPLTVSEKKTNKIKDPWDAYFTMDKKILKIKVIK